jgi:type IV secretion system protein VirB9
MKKITFLLLTCSLLSVVAQAEQEPMRLTSDKRIGTVAYTDNNVVPIIGAPLVSTRVVFGQDETIIKIDAGDAGGWSLNKSDNSFTIKPTTDNSAGNLTVETDKHVYYFSLRVNGHATPLYAVRFIYPEQDRMQKEGLLSGKKAPSDYNWNYSFNGDKRIIPVHVYDDGQFTYMQLQPNQPVPSVFAVDNVKGEESVVNFRQRGDILVIQQIAAQFTLRSGQDKVGSIFNDKEVEKMRRNNWTS